MNDLFLATVKSALESGVAVRFEAAGTSMVPFIKDGDVITVSPIGSVAPSVGDVVAVGTAGSGGLVLHRIVRRDRTGYWIRGDNCLASDGLVCRSDLLGRVTAVARDDKAVALGLGSERLFIALLSRQGILTRLVRRACRIARLCRSLRRAGVPSGRWRRRARTGGRTEASRPATALQAHLPAAPAAHARQPGE
jgi:hypothetical protein